MLASVASVAVSCQLSAVSGGPQLPRSEPLAIASAKTSAVARLVVASRSHAPLVSGVGGFELALTVEVPLATVDRAIFAASLTSVRHAPFASRSKRRRLRGVSR